MNKGPQAFAILIVSALLAVSGISVSAQDSQEFHNLKAQVEELRIEQDNREWDELAAKQKADEAKQQACAEKRERFLNFATEGHENH